MAPWAARAVALCAAALAAQGLPAAPAAPYDLVPDFERLWRAVVAGGMTQGGLVDIPDIRVACQYGLSNASVEIARWLLSAPLRPGGSRLEALEVSDVDGPAEAKAGATLLMSQLEAEFGRGRVRRAADGGARAEPRICDLVVYSEAAPRFSVERILHRVGDHVVVALVSHECILDEVQIQTPRCNMVNMLWEKTVLHKLGYCNGAVCMSLVPTARLQDPHTLPLDCAALGTEGGSNASTSEFGQDWFLRHNFLTAGERGVYVDVGASLPFEFSNTVGFDRCLGWEGVCVEPNPYLTHMLEAHRGCKVVQACVDSARQRGKQFTDRDGEPHFTANCLPLGEILTKAGLRGKTIDVLSVDVEHGEMKVLKGLPLEDFDIRFIIIEVTPGATWLQVDTVLLPRGYAKVAILGRDVIYAKLGELRRRGFGSWPAIGREDGRPELPPGWDVFHQEVVSEEMETEREAEAKAHAKGLRRT